MALDALGRRGFFSRGNCCSVRRGIRSEGPSISEWDGGQASSNARPRCHSGSARVFLKLASAAAAPLTRLCSYRHDHALSIAAISNVAAKPLKDDGPTIWSSSRRIPGHLAGSRWSSEGRLCSSSINGGSKSGSGGENGRLYLCDPVQHIEHSPLASQYSLRQVMSYARGRHPGDNSPGHHHGQEPWSYFSNNIFALKGPGEGRVSEMRSARRERSGRSDFPWPKGVDDPRFQQFTSARPRRNRYHGELPPRHVYRNCIPQPRDTPPQRDTGIASEKDWNINLKNELSTDSGINEDGSTWYRESGEDFGDNGYRCRWTVMGGKNGEGSSEWREVWWEKSDWTGYKELGAEKSGKNPQGDSWWETWQEVLRQDDWSNLARIERSAQKQAKSGSGSAGWYEKWWEKYNPKGWSEKGAHKYGRLNDQGWWEKWGEQYDGRGAVLKWTDKWAETDMGTKWGDKWEEKFTQGIGTRQGETWHYSANGERWSRTWGEEHVGTGKVHKYGKSTSGESWDSIVDEGTFYQAEPHYGWADAVGNSVQLLAIEALERPPGIYPDLDLGMPQ